MIVPLAAADGDAVVAGKAFVSAGGNELFSSAAEELLQVHRGGLLFLRIGKVDVLAHRPLLKTIESCRPKGRLSIVKYEIIVDWFSLIETLPTFAANFSTKQLIILSYQCIISVEM